MRVENMTSSRGNKVANQFVLFDGAKVTFQSYESTIAVVDNDTKTITFGLDWNYSNTTGKYRNIFFNDYICELSTLDSSKSVDKAIKDGYVIDKIGIKWAVNYISKQAF